jgi:hypothetical protein
MEIKSLQHMQNTPVRVQTHRANVVVFTKKNDAAAYVAADLASNAEIPEVSRR